MKYLLLIYILCFSLNATAQPHIDANYLKSIYDRCLEFSEDQLDSLYYYADFIAAKSRQLKFIQGEVLSLRLKGVYYDIKGEYESAIDYSLKSLTVAQKINSTEYEIASLSDLAILYSHIKHPEWSKRMYLRALALAKSSNYKGSLATTYCNLGAIYNQLKDPDSSLLFLEEGIRLSKLEKQHADLSTLYNNIGNAYFSKKEYVRSLGYFRMNEQQHQLENSLSSLWTDYLNVADVFIEIKKYDSALIYCNKSLEIAKKLNSKSKESDSYALFSKLYDRKKQYQLAYEYQQKWYFLDTSLVNSETNNTIAELQEKYNSQKRQRDNDLLTLEVEKQKLYAKLVTYLAIASFVIAVLVVLSLIQKRRINKKLEGINKLIIRQNEKLTELNNEKNALISIVSHDLATPFASIKMWGQVLQQNETTLNAEQERAVDRIINSTKRGEELIKNILNVERAETNSHVINLKNFDIVLFVKSIVEDFRPAANGKNIQLHFTSSAESVFIISDEQLVHRICENLLSNAIKYSPKEKSVYISINEEKDTVSLHIKDEGVGIQASEIPLLFSKYSRISSRPTDGETSNGLGLSIVKRIVQELNGSITCESEQGVGSLFTVILKK